MMSTTTPADLSDAELDHFDAGEAAAREPYERMFTRIRELPYIAAVGLGGARRCTVAGMGRGGAGHQTLRS